MNIFDRFFKPYAEYCVETAFSEEELKKILAEEFSPYRLMAGFKAALGGTGMTFSGKRSRPLVLHPGLHGGNFLRGEIAIQCAGAAHSRKAVLHITIAPPNPRWIIRAVSVFCIMSGILLVCAGMRQAIFPFLMQGLLFMLLAVCRSMAEGEIPEIRREFENRLRILEKKYLREEDHVERKS